MTGKPLRVLVVDDTVVYRKIVSDVLSDIPGVEVVGTANNGKIALSRIKTLKPDLLTLDVEMPEMTGLETLEQIQKEALDVGAIMVSSLTQKGSEMTIRALELGAFDFIPKPQGGGGMAENRLALKDSLLPKIKAFGHQREIRKILKGKTRTSTAPGKVETRITQEKPATVVRRMDSLTAGLRRKSLAVGIAISTGGPNALSVMMPSLPANMGVPVLIVQHMPPMFTKHLAVSLNAKCALEVVEAEDGQEVTANRAYIAPGGKQMKIAAGLDGRKIVRITNDPPENNCRPSADYLFRSMAQVYEDRVTGVIMTGMGSDGVLGLKLMKRKGALVIAQDAASCVVYGMPKEAVDAGVADIVAPLDLMASEIQRTVRG